MECAQNGEQQRAWVYFNEEYAGDIRRLIEKGYHAAQDIDPVIVKNGTVLPHYESDWSVMEGVLDEDGELVPESKVSSKYGKKCDGWKEAIFVDKKVVYLGSLWVHYGHFLIESTARLWYWLEKGIKEEGLVPVFSYDFNKRKKIPDYIVRFFALCGMRMEDIYLVRGPVRFSQVIVPRLSFDLSMYTDKFLLPFRRAAAAVPAGKAEKVYLTRTQFKTWNTQVTWGEEEVEKEFKKNGFKVVAMEALSLDEQISVMKGARVIAGVSGTALHGAVYGEHIEDVIILNRAECGAEAQFVINEAIGAKTYVCRAYVDILPSPSSYAHTGGPYFIGMTRWMHAFFRDYGLKAYTGEMKPEKYLRSYLQAYRESVHVQAGRSACQSAPVPVECLDHFFALEARSSCILPLRLLWLRILSHVAWGNWGTRLRSRYRYYRSLRRYPILRERGED